MFTDDSSFFVRPIKNQLRVWRNRRKGYERDYTFPTFKTGYRTVNLWGEFSAYGRTPLVCILGSFNQQSYLSFIDTYILQFMNEKHDGPASFILQEDNCGPHKARSIATYLKMRK